MSVRPFTIGLGIALLASLFANAFLFLSAIDTAHGWADQESVSRHLRDERSALRNLTLRLAQGEQHRAAFDAVLRESGASEPYEKNGWWGAYPLLARFDGERLLDVCWTVSYSNEQGPCSTEDIEGPSVPAESSS